MITGTIIAVSGLMSYAFSFPPEVKARFEAEDKLRQFVPELSKIEERFSDDSQEMLGLATIYERYSPSFDYWNRSTQLYQKAAALDPNNKAIRAALVRKVLVDFISQRKRVLMQLGPIQEYAKRENLKEVEIPSWGGLYEWLHEEGQDKVVIRDFNETRAYLCKKLDRDLPVVIDELSKSEQFEPENALYNYLRAQLNFELGKDSEGLAEFEKGSRKPYLKHYWVEIAAAKKKVLQESGFPEPSRKIIVNIPPPIGGMPATPDKIFGMAKQQQESNNPRKATEIYEAIIRTTKQIKEEPVPNKANGKRGGNWFSERVETQAREQLTKIRQ